MRGLQRLPAAVLNQSSDLLDVSLVIGAKLPERLTVRFVGRRVDGNAVGADGVVIELEQIVQRGDACDIAGQHEGVRHGISPELE
jgi:hypothetical protein